MKKYFIFAAAALVALTACSKVETDNAPAKKISFNAALYTAQTKADPATTHSLYDAVADGGEGVSSFQSKAFLHADSDGDGVLDSQNMFGTTGETVSYSTDNKEWAPSSEYFWPKAASSYINFVSWYTKNAKSQLVASDITETAMNWGTTSSPVTIVYDDNILFADEAWGYKDNVRNPATYGYNNVTEGVPTLFHHALAKLAFNMKLSTTTASTQSKWQVDIIEASLKIGNNGYLALTNAEPSSTPATSAWKVGANAATSEIVGWARPTTSTLETLSQASGTTSDGTNLAKLSFTNFAPTALTSGKYESDPQVFLAERTVMPQTLGTTVKFSLKFKISVFHTGESTAYSQEIITITEDNLATIVPAITAWNMNTKYVYNITIDPVGKKVLFDPAVVDWNTPSAVERQVYPTPAS